MTDIRSRFDALRGADHADPADLDALWADLATVEVEEILGPWRGGDFATGHVASAVLKKVRWHGKRFDGPLAAVPMLCRNEEGQLYSNLEAGGGGEATLWPVGFRGEVTATMVYDRMPVFDHFKRVDEDTLMGIMNGKLEAAFGVKDLYYFWLERDA
ncbi:hypothetical protein ASE01_13405 [Nocardioides sp. Root190]|uniref:DUF4334 domain-containing protein n=1 Tax=Nocardioides sp. Root190 TaxID=1736488 RepID=UPI0006F4E52D|nr:DUF4334 domain-containing protein [Nocardioides sp. Root190]KRB76027.1 hypothetical protein ASE01_13405 [Nocardioides sp. Root190]